MTKLNVPAFKQHYSATCGITCVRMINAYFHPEYSNNLNCENADKLYADTLLRDLKGLNLDENNIESIINKSIVGLPESRIGKNILNISLDEYVNISKSGDEIRLLVNHILKNNIAIIPFDDNNRTEQSLENYIYQVSKKEYSICPPLINGNNHYMLITGIEGSTVYYNDPIDGKSKSMPFENLKSKNCQVLKVGPKSLLLPKSMRK